MDITKHDKNFIVPTKIDREALVYHSIEEKAFSPHGVLLVDGKYHRMP